MRGIPTCVGFSNTLALLKPILLGLEKAREYSGKVMVAWFWPLLTA